jgi:hypothetical protein
MRQVIIDEEIFHIRLPRKRRSPGAGFKPLTIWEGTAWKAKPTLNYCLRLPRRCVVPPDLLRTHCSICTL